MEIELKERMREGKGKVEIRHLFNEKTELKGHCRLLGRVSIEQGASIGLHPHEQEEEIYYILKGRARVIDTIDGRDESYEAGPGDAILTGNGNRHSIENIGEEPLEFMAVILTY